MIDKMKQKQNQQQLKGGEEQMEQQNIPYFVLSEYSSYVGSKGYGNCKNFQDYQGAQSFALSNLPAVLARRLPMSSDDEPRVKFPDKRFVVVGEYSIPLYSMGEYDGNAQEFKVSRCNEGQLEKAIARAARKGAEKVFAGVELKLV